MCFVFNAKAFDDVVTSEKLKSDYLKNERSFRSEKTFFLVSKVLPFRHTKQTSKNVVDTTFKRFFIAMSRPDCFLQWRI